VLGAAAGAVAAAQAVAAATDGQGRRQKTERGDRTTAVGWPWKESRARGEVRERRKKTEGLSEKKYFDKPLWTCGASLKKFIDYRYTKNS